MKYLKSKSGKLFIKDLGDGFCVSIHLNTEISYEKMIHYVGINLEECDKTEVMAAYNATMEILKKII